MWDPELLRLHAYWTTIRPDGVDLPGRRHIDPLDLPPSLWSRMYLCELRPDGGFFVRRVGSDVVALGRFDLTNKPMADAPIDMAPLESWFRTIVERREPGWFQGRSLVGHRGWHQMIQNLTLPLAADGATVDMLIGAMARLPGDVDLAEIRHYGDPPSD